jgi:carboxyl-terminal processing protease
VLDLRGAAFGPPADAVRVAELFLKGGVVARLAGRKSAEQVFTADATRAAWDLPLAVLVGTGTSGPGEVVAAALLDADRATLVGERTFGRAAVQKAVPLFDGGLIVTVAKYVTPKGAPIHGRGIEPGVRVETPEEEDVEAGVSSADPALDKAIELLAGQDRKAA